MASTKFKSLLLQVLVNSPIVLSILVCIELSASAQIIPDRTLPNNTIVLPKNSIFEITGGTTAGNNLFHSFETFSLTTKQTAFFNNPVTIENIFSRVTGGSASNIDGLIRANGTANLFLINPNGIIFGSNAELNVGGSFIASTASSIQFANGNEFSAINSQSPPLLIVSVPVGLNFGSNRGEITVKGTGSNISFNRQNTSLLNRDQRNVGLQVQPGKTLALIGGNVVIEGGNLTAQAGRVELGSIGEPATLKLNSTSSGWALSYDGIKNFQDIRLSNAASVEVSGNSGGTIQLQGRKIQLQDGSSLLADTLGNGSGGTLNLNASESVELTGISPSPIFFVTYLSTSVAPKATGNGGNVFITTEKFRVANGAQIFSSTNSSGSAGSITVKAKEVELTGGSSVNSSSGLFALVNRDAIGSGGKILIDTQQLSLTGGGQASVSTAAVGNGGSIEVQATNIELISASSQGHPSGLFASVRNGATGNGGSITLNTQRLQATNGGQISGTTSGSGNGGTVTVQAKEIELLRGSAGAGPSGIFANVQSNATGNGGKLIVNSDRLLISDGAQIAVTTFAKGDGGNLQLTAGEIELIGTSPRGLPSGLFVNVESTTTAKGGNIAVNTERMRLRDGAQIGTITSSNDNAGNINVKANELELIGGSTNGPSSLFSAVAPQAKGNGGNLTVDVRNLRLINGGQIAVSTAGSGKGGNLSINAKNIELIGVGQGGSSGLFGSAVIGTGDGGILNVNTDNLILKDGGIISASNYSSRNPNTPPGKGKAGNIEIKANSVLLDNTQSQNLAKITTASASGKGGDINLRSQLLQMRHNSSISATANGDRSGGNITLNVGAIAQLENSDITANAFKGKGGNINIITRGIFRSQDSDITASSKLGVDGTVNISTPDIQQQNNLVQQSSKFVSTEQVVAKSCLERRNAEQAKFVVSSSGGIPENPTGNIIQSYSVIDVHPIKATSITSIPQQSTTVSTRPWKIGDSIVEAQQLTASADGKLLLLATPAQIPASAQSLTCLD